MTEGRFRIALLGCGSFGARHARAISALRGASLTALFDPVPTSAIELSRQFGVPAANRLQEIWDDPSIDAVVIAAPTDTHHNLTVAAASAGKHVLVEKPAALSIEQLTEMQRVCDERGVVLFVGQTLRYHPVPQAFHRSVREGVIGDPVYLNWIGNSRRPWPGGWSGWQSSRERSGGMLLHLGIHSIDLALWLLGDRPARVFAQGVTFGTPGLEFPNVVQITIRGRNGSNALLELHTNLPGNRSAFMSGRLIGTLGQTEWALNEDGVAFTDQGADLLFTGYDQSLRDELLHFIDCCSGKRSPLVTAEQALDALTVGIAAERSISIQDAVEIASILEETG
jgi:predicted dehydrogenase